MMVQLEPLARALVKRISIGISQLELDVFMIGFHRFWADPEFFCDPGGPEAGASQGKDMQLAVSQARSVGMCCRLLDDLVNSAQCDPRTYIKLTCENSPHTV
jgi:hypothetical protein